MSSSTANAAQRKFRINLVLLFAVFALPLIAAYLSYYVWPPKGRVNYGELIAQTPVPDVALQDAQGNVLPLSKLRGKWIMLTVDSPACEKACDEKLFFMRQIRISMTKEMQRIERVMLLSSEGKVSAELLKKYQGMHVLSGANDALLNALAHETNIADHIYLIDPLGNIMMRYGKNPDAAGVRNDLGRLLSVSQVG
jgi:cytochrome oxidase Cu insertion factor (SCO1/SenC/PrrC family)